MACEDFLFAASGRRGIGVAQPQSGIDYPFVAPKPAESADEDFRELIADFDLSYDDLTGQVQHPLRIKYLYNIGCVDNAPPAGFPAFFDQTPGIVVVDADDSVVFSTVDGGAELEQQNWTDNYNIYRWTRADGSACALVVYLTWPPESAPRHYVKHLAPKDAVLDERAVYRIPRRLLTLSVRQKNSVTKLGPYSGKMRFKNSYNTEIVTGATTTTNFRVNTPITLSAVAGSGIGYYPVCGSGFDENNERLPQPIRRINGVGATDAGDFLLSGGDCIYTRRPTTSINGAVRPSTTAHLQVGADCAQCCTCQEYVETALYMNNTRNRYRLIGERLSGLKLIHEQNIAKWEDKRACSLLRPLKLIFVPQNCPSLDVVAMVCNPCETCLPGSTLTLQLDTVPAGVVDGAGANFASIKCGYTALFAPNVNGKAVPITITAVTGNTMSLSFKMPAINAGSSAYLKFRLKFKESSNYTVRGILTAVLDGNGGPLLVGCAGETPPEDRIIASAETTQALYCTSDGQTDMPC